MAVREWLTVDETAGRLSRSPRTLEKWMRDGKLKWKVEREGARTRKMFHAGEVEKLASALSVAEQNAGELSRLKSERREETTLAQIHREHEERLAQINRQYEERIKELTDRGNKMLDRLSLASKIWLTLEEAAQLSGLSIAYIKTMIELLKIRAVRGGPRRTWRVLRASLEAFAG